MDKQTRIIAIRSGPFGEIKNKVSFLVKHPSDKPLLPALERCVTEWLKLPENAETRKYTAGDFNFGDLACFGLPTKEFSKQFGIEIVEEEDVEEMVVDYDHVLDLGDDIEEEDAE